MRHDVKASSTSKLDWIREMEATNGTVAAFARIVDGFKLDVGDYVGCAVSLVGVVIAVAWPREGGGLS
ncbi:unnamed protein product [Bathycoccus prasinos]